MTCLKQKANQEWNLWKQTVISKLATKGLRCPDRIIEREMKAASVLRKPDDRINWITEVVNAVIRYCQPMNERSHS